MKMKKNHIVGTVPDYIQIIVERGKIYTRNAHIHDNSLFKKSLKIPKGQSESVYRRTDNTMAKRKSTKGQTAIYKTYI
jgi:hypothetical protein